MTHLTLQEVIERIRKDVPLKNSQQTQGATRVEDQRHRPEFYIPRIARRLAEFRFFGFAR